MNQIKDSWISTTDAKLLMRVLIILALTVSGDVLARERTQVLQQGLYGYSGVRDTWVSSSDWDEPPQYTVNYGQNGFLMLSRDGGDNPLIGFDLSMIPENSSVISATLSLYNTTVSAWSGARVFTRRINLHKVLKDWDEGNQIASPIDSPLKHGATGDWAFRFFPGEGSDIPWVSRGMASEGDYQAGCSSYSEAGDPGWYQWDATELVRQWVRKDAPNFGMTLRDATGYEDDHKDNRDFVSAQGEGSLRPILTVVYNPDVPYADAGPDRENLIWNGSPITLDGSGSRDRPGGDDEGLTYCWRILKAAYGSSMGGDLPDRAKTVGFLPDVPGEWDVELTVTNKSGERAADNVHLRILKIPSSHPRIFLTPERLTLLHARAVSENFRWTQLLAEADLPDSDMIARALVHQVTGIVGYRRAAIDQAFVLMADPGEWSMKAGNIALIYDWCFDGLSAEEKDAFISYFNAWGDKVPKGEDIPGWGNYWPRYGYDYGLIGLATYGENPRAKEWIDEYRHRRIGDNDIALLDRIKEGGSWPEGTVYDWIANWPRVKALEAWRTATGEDLFQSTQWFRDRVGFLLLQHLPGTTDQWGQIYHPYTSIGDGERNRGTMANYGRIMALILIERFASDPAARELQAYLGTPPADNSSSFLFHEEFLWSNPDQQANTPSRLTHFSPDTGTLLMRSGWPDGASDTDRSATYLTFQCGDHFTYHQHYEQNSFTLFKYGDLLVDSGVYSEDGLSSHDINYYVRTIAHNTLLVHNPQEDFSHARPDASSNDGGQRSFYPASRSPQGVSEHDQHGIHYETGDILGYQDRVHSVYIKGDATRAYNSPVYYQAMDTGLAGNVPKVSRFLREMVYLRPVSAQGKEFVILFDRIGVTGTGFSGENTKLLFHTLEEPLVGGEGTEVSKGETLYPGAGEAEAIAGDGKVFFRFLLPSARNIRKVGGRGEKAFWVFDGNYDWHWEPGEPQPRPTNSFEDTPYGEWRLELEPSDEDLDHRFLTLLHPSLASTAAMPDVSLVSGTGVEGVHIAEPELNRLVLFSSSEDGSPPAGSIIFTYKASGLTQQQIFGLEPGARYNSSMLWNGDEVSVTLTPSPKGGVMVTEEGAVNIPLNNPGLIYLDPEGICGGETPCFTIPQMGLDHLADGGLLLMSAKRFDGPVIMDQDKKASLRCGWDGLGISQVSELRGALAVDQGTLEIRQGSLLIH